MVPVERAGVLGQRLHVYRQAGQRLSVRAVRLRGRDHVRARGVHRAVDGHRRPVDDGVTLDDLPEVVHPHQVALPHKAEVQAERVDPVRVGELRVPRRDVTGRPFVQAGLAEHPKRGSKHHLPVSPLLLHRLPDRF